MNVMTMKNEIEDIIRVISPPHCARGPTRCEQCKEALKNSKICLLRLYSNGSEVSRPVMEVTREGERMFFPFDVMKYFESKDDALEYAKKHSISDVDIERESY